jgi:hypothetical protein
MIRRRIAHSLASCAVAATILLACPRGGLQGQICPGGIGPPVVCNAVNLVGEGKTGTYTVIAGKRYFVDQSQVTFDCATGGTSNCAVCAVTILFFGTGINGPWTPNSSWSDASTGTKSCGTAGNVNYYTDTYGPLAGQSPYYKMVYGMQPLPANGTCPRPSDPSYTAYGGAVFGD